MNMLDDSLMQMRKFVAPEFIFGPGASTMAGQYCRNLGARRVLVVTMPGLMQYDWYQCCVKSLTDAEVPHEVFTEVSENPRDHEVMAGVEFYAVKACDAILAIGGGSAMDCAKGIGIAHSNEAHVLEFEGVDNVARPGPPLVCVPTTAGSSADVSQFAIINDTTRKVKIAIVSKTVVPDAALIDSDTTVSMDRALTINTGLDALTHAMEAYASNASSAVTDLCALEALRRIGANLPQAARSGDDREARAGMMLGSMYAGMAFSNAILGAVHSMAHSLGGLSDLPHGLCNAILLDLVVAFNYDSASERYDKAAEALAQGMGREYRPGRENVLELLRQLKADLGANQSLGDLGVKREDLNKLAEMAMQDPCMVTNPRKPTQEQILEIFEKAL